MVVRTTKVKLPQLAILRVGNIHLRSGISVERGLGVTHHADNLAWKLFIAPDGDALANRTFTRPRLRAPSLG